MPKKNPTSRGDTKTSVPGVYKRGNRYSFKYRDPQGRQRRRSARTLAEAKQIKATVQADIVRGDYRTLSRTTFAEYANEWIETYQGRTSKGIRKTTLDEYRRVIEREAIPYFGGAQ